MTQKCSKDVNKYTFCCNSFSFILKGTGLASTEARMYRIIDREILRTAYTGWLL